MSSSAPGELGCDRDETETVEQRLQLVAWDIGRDTQVRRVVGATARRGQERTLEIEAQRLRAIGRRGRQPFPDALREFDQGGHRGRRRRRQERRDPVTQEAFGHPIKSRVVAHRIMAAPTVDVYVDEPRRDIGAVGTSAVSARAAPELDPDDPVVLDGDHASLDPVVEDQPTRDRPLGHRAGAESGAEAGPSRTTSTQRRSRADRAMASLTSISS